MDAGVHGDAAPCPVRAARRARPVQDTSAGRAVRRHGVDGSLPSDPRNTGDSGGSSSRAMYYKRVSTERMTSL